MVSSHMALASNRKTVVNTRDTDELEDQPMPTSSAGPRLPTPILAAGKWKTADSYLNRRISPMKNPDGEIIGYRPMIQRGRGELRQTHSEVFRITDQVNVAMALEMAQRWRDQKELELGINAGQLSVKSAARFVPGISLVVSTKAPYRAYWKWSQRGHKKITAYMSAHKGFIASYEMLVDRICKYLKYARPAQTKPPAPSDIQCSRLQKMGITDLPCNTLKQAPECPKRLS
jgi:hypothetical protein